MANHASTRTTQLYDRRRDEVSRVVCPIPRYLVCRAPAGIFYDLVKSAGFDNPFGNSFQAYVGEVINVTCSPPRFTALAEQPYHVGTQKKPVLTGFFQTARATYLSKEKPSG
jgi:hypothetical protein